MDWNLAIEDNRRMLKRIVAMLFALAVLAERLTGLPRPVRAHVLRILHSAEAVAWDFVLQTKGHHASAPLPAPLGIPSLQDGDSPADAVRLAQNFRILAFLLNWLAERTFGCSERPIALAACTTIARLLAAMSLDLIPLFPTTASLTIERRDSS